MSMADTSAAPSATPLVSARGISKQFGGVEVLTDVDVEFWAAQAVRNR